LLRVTWVQDLHKRVIKLLELRKYNQHRVFLKARFKNDLSYFRIVLEVIICPNHYSDFNLGEINISKPIFKRICHSIELYFFNDALLINTWNLDRKYRLFIESAYKFVSTLLSDDMFQNTEGIEVVGTLFARAFQMFLYICNLLF